MKEEPEWMTPQDRWAKKSGYMTKGFKLKRELVDEFEKTCDNQGISQASAISTLMNDFIKSNYIQSSE